jgi:ribosomal protein S18 acetylase RimI-like enzyme
VVDPGHRGKGIGSLLIQEVAGAARSAGMSAVTLEVVDTNDSAQSLYERQGFRLSKTIKTGRLTENAGFRAVRVMKLDLTP